jgi:putative transcriptional regulator
MGERLRKLRQAAGLSQAELAARAGLTVDSVQNWEQGRSEPSLSRAARLARALGTSLDELAGLNKE